MYGGNPYGGQQPMHPGGPHGGAPPPHHQMGQRGPPQYAPQQGYGGGAPPPRMGGAPPVYATGHPGPQPGYGAPPPQQGGNHWYSSYANAIAQQEMMQLRGWFASIDKNRSGRISARELQNLSFGPQRFSLETAKQLVLAFDADNSGEIEFNEYAALHRFVNSLMGRFHEMDVDGSGRLTPDELADALRQEGFNFSSMSIVKMAKRFGGRSSKQGLTFEQFVRLAAYVARVRSVFMQRDQARNGFIQADLQTFLEMVEDINPTLIENW